MDVLDVLVLDRRLPACLRVCVMPATMPAEPSPRVCTLTSSAHRCDPISLARPRPPRPRATLSRRACLCDTPHTHPHVSCAPTLCSTRPQTRRLLPTRETRPQRPPRLPDPMQHDHLDQQRSRCPSSLRASPSIRKTSSLPFVPALGAFPGPRCAFSGPSSRCLTCRSDSSARVPPARAHGGVCVPVLVRALDLEPVLRLRRRRAPRTAPEPLLRRVLARARHACHALHAQRSLCLREPVATRHQLPRILQPGPPAAAAPPAHVCLLGVGGRRVRLGGLEWLGPWPQPRAGDGHPRRRRRFRRRRPHARRPGAPPTTAAAVAHRRRAPAPRRSPSSATAAPRAHKPDAGLARPDRIRVWCRPDEHRIKPNSQCASVSPVSPVSPAIPNSH